MTAYPPKIYWRNFACVLGLLALTWSISYINLGHFNLIIALTIAFAKLLLIALFFMHIKGSSRLLHLAAFAALLWLVLMLTLTLADYFSRGRASVAVESPIYFCKERAAGIGLSILSAI